MSTVLEEITSLYEAYLDEFHRLERDSKPFEGAFGFGGGPKDHPCHEKFAQDLEKLLYDLTAQEPSSGEAAEVLRYIYCGAPSRWETEATVYWMLLAVQGYTLGLIERLNAADAGALYDTYRDLYPRRQQLPVQSKVFAALRARSRAK